LRLSSVRIPGYIALYIAGAIVAAVGFTTLITRVNEKWFAPDLAMAVFIVLLGKYSQSRPKNERH
jgi:hypothetical protein